MSIEWPLSVHWFCHFPNPHMSTDTGHFRKCVHDSHMSSQNCCTSDGSIRLAEFQHVKPFVSWHNQPLHDHIQVFLPSMSPYGSQSGLQLIRLFSFSFGSSSTACVLTQPRVAWPHPCCQKHNVNICLWVKSCVLNPHMSIDARYSRNCVLNPHILGPNCFTSGGSIQIAGLQHVKLNVQIYVSQRSTLVIT